MGEDERFVVETDENAGTLGVFVELGTTERKFDPEQLGITWETPPNEIIEAVRGPVLEENGIDIGEIYEVRKVRNEDTNERKILIKPKATAG